MSSLAVLGVLAASVCFFRSLDSAAENGRGADVEARIAAGFAIAPVPLNLHGRDRILIGLGSYIVNAQSACNDCHTDPLYAPGHDPFKGGDGQINAAGYLKGGKVGTVTAPDLTPDAQGLPGGLTFEKFSRAMTHGEDPDDPRKILQVMPWPVYRNMAPCDLRAIYEYLRALPSSHPAP